MKNRLENRKKKKKKETGDEAQISYLRPYDPHGSYAGLILNPLPLAHGGSIYIYIYIYGLLQFADLEFS